MIIFGTHLKAAAAQTEKHKTNKKFRKEEKANKEAASARFGLNNKYVADKKVTARRLKVTRIRFSFL